jgi:hypothetical protein
MGNTRRKSLVVAALAFLGPAALAQEGDAGRISGHDPAARPAPEMRTFEAPMLVENEGDKLLGLGYGTTPGGVTGVTLEYYLGGSVMVNAIFGLATFSPKNGSSATTIDFAGGAFYRCKNWNNVSLMLGGRVDIAHLFAGGISGGSGDATQFSIEFPMRGQIYFAHFLAVYAEVAVVLSFIGDNGAVLEPSFNISSRGKGVYIDIPLSELIGAFGATFYFR